MTGIALGWIGSISGFGSQVRNAKTSPSVDGRHMPANAATGVPVTENQISSRPALGLGSAKRVKGTRQRCSGFDSIDRQNGLARFRTFVTRDRKSVVSGQSVSVRVDLGGRRNIKKKKV